MFEPWLIQENEIVGDRIMIEVPSMGKSSCCNESFTCDNSYNQIILNTKCNEQSCFLSFKQHFGHENYNDMIVIC